MVHRYCIPICNLFSHRTARAHWAALYLDPNQSANVRVNELIRKLAPEQKILQVKMQVMELLHRRRFFWIVMVFGISFTWTLSGYGQKIASIVVQLPHPTEGIGVTASVDLDPVTYVPDSSLVLLAVDGNKRTAVPFQISRANRRTLHWIMPSDSRAAKKYVFELVKGTPPSFDQINAEIKEGALTIHQGSKNLLRYQFRTVYPPLGIDTAFKRSAFIHPLWTPHGQELTRIQAPDHYHHYGIWNPWTHVLFERDTVDFWNLKSRKGTVRFGNFISVTNGAVYAEFKALHQHVVFKKDGAEKVALNEMQTVRVYHMQNSEDNYLVDITIELNCATESPFGILAYRYAGLGWRATEKWNKSNSEVFTSEGRTRKDADGSDARWFVVQGSLDNDYGGSLWMSYPTNYDHPEPLRVWPENSNAIGEVFAMFAPTKNKDWLLRPGESYALRYRFVVFNGHFSKEKAESAWHYFAVQPVVEVKKN